MIDSITIANIASYGSPPAALAGLSQFNFVFGSNASGKTTISRIIADEDKFTSCKVSWKGGTRLQPMVYNQDFVERNFSQSADLKGVFTLGEKNVDTLSKIAAAKLELDAFATRIEDLTHSLEGDDGIGGKRGELAAIEASLKDKCWAQKLKHDAKLQGAFEGYRGSSEKFKNKLVLEMASNGAGLLPLADLETRAETVFGPSPTSEPDIPAIETAKLIALETAPILKKRVIGKDDVDIAAMIKKLGNSDWVREGRLFYQANEGICPFCQQKTPENFATSLREYFDEAFVADSKAIDGLQTDYSTEALRLKNQIESIIANPSRFLDVEKLKAEKEIFVSKTIINNQRLSEKRKEPSRVVELESLSNAVAAIKAILDAASALVAQHNRMVANLSQERRTLTAQVWRFVLEELKTELDAYKAAREGIDKAIAAISGQIATAKAGKTGKTAEIRELEKQITSVQPTIDGINALLSSFGFQGFSLAKAAGNTSYRLIRADGSDARTTLSEGEKSFVAFLYFYHLLKGSDTESGMTADRIVVFDDPVSSLDSDILFIVGSLIKGLFEEVRAGTGHIKQVFILTHNVYFHKEVSFNRKRQKEAMTEETFWVVRKPGLASVIEKHPTNPIKTSYELLWAEVRRGDRSNLTIQNTLRRILENYFKILGGYDFEKLCALFTGKEKMICNSLCSWVHDGSHYAHDDLFLSIEDSMVDKYLKVFREIFYRSGHGNHYKMMMGDAFVEEIAEAEKAPAIAPPK